MLESHLWSTSMLHAYEEFNFLKRHKFSVNQSTDPSIINLVASKYQYLCLAALDLAALDIIKYDCFIHVHEGKFYTAKLQAIYYDLNC